MLPLDAGGYLVDTPGFSEVGLWAIDPEELDTCFPEFRPLLGELPLRRLPASLGARMPGAGWSGVGSDRAGSLGELSDPARGAGERTGGLGVKR